ncbi:hypothetical protein Tco_0505439 [Tanacetum coccineum]
METKDTLSSCSYSDEQDMQQMLKQAKILKGSCLNGLSALKSNFTRTLEQGITKSEFERAFSHIFGEDVDTFTRTFSQNMDTLEQQLTKETILESNCQNAFRDFRAYTSMEPQLFKEIILKNFDFIEDYMLKTIIHAQTIQKRLDDKKLQIQECTVQEVKALDAISEDKAKKSCMVSFRKLHSHLKHLSHDNLKGTRIESGFKRAFATLFGQDVETFIGTMFLNMDQLEKQLDKEEFQEIGSIASFKVLETQFQMFIKSRMYLDDEFVVMTSNYFLQYTQLAILEFHDTLIQHMESVKKSIDERAQHKREYDSWVNERQIQTTEGKVDTGKAVDASLVNTESIRTESKEQDTSSRSGNDAHADDADIRPIYDEEPMVEVQTTAEINIFATGQQHTEQPEFNNERKVDQNAEQCHDTYPLPTKLTDNQTTELLNQYLESENIRLKKTVAQFQKDFLRMEAHCVNLELKYQNQALKEGQHGQFLKVTSNEAKPRISKQRFTSQVDVNNDLSKPVTPHYLPKERESAVAKPHHMIAPVSSRYSSNDMVHKHYLEEAKKKTQESTRNSEPSVMPSARSQRTANGSKPKPRIHNQKSRNWPASKSSCVTTNIVPIAEHSRNSKSFSDSKHFVCSTCHKCVFNANHDSCVTKFLNEFNSRAKVPSNKTTKRYIPVEQTSFAKNPERQILKGHKSSINKTSVVHEKTMTHISCLRCKPTGKIFKTVGLRWVPTGKIFTSSTTKVDSKPQNGSNDDITNQYECKQTLDVSAGTLNIHAGTSLNPTKEGLRVCSELGIHDHNNELSSSKLVPKVVPQAEKTATSRQELELLFHHHITMLRSYALSWKPCQGDSLNLPDHRIHKDGDGDASFQLESDSLPHAHAQTTKTYYKH